MPDDANPRFSGVPSTPAPEVFERARSNNPAWYQIMERAYAQFAARPENAGIYADPKGGGATIEQIWLVHTLFGIEPYCLLARALPAASTQRISRLVNCKAAQIVEALKAIQAADGAVTVNLRAWNVQRGCKVDAGPDHPELRNALDLAKSFVSCFAPQLSRS